MNPGAFAGLTPGPVQQHSGFPLFTAYFASSGTWVAPISGWATFFAVGGGGSGAYIRESGRANATGGGAAGSCWKRLYVNAGDRFTITVGAGGALVSGNPVTGSANGNAGGATSIVGPSVNMIANGGGGGTAGTTGTVVGGIGGTSYGGDANFTGGSAGSISATGAFAAATGGGSVGIFRNGFNSGSISGTNTEKNSTGGAGIGGSSLSLNNAGNTATNGGGSARDGTTATNNPFNQSGVAAGLLSGILTLTGHGSAGSLFGGASSASAGGGGGGGNSNGGPATGGAGGAFGGGGGAASSTLGSFDGCAGGNCGVGAGSGGAAQASGNGYGIGTYDGGPGFAFIAIY